MVLAVTALADTFLSSDNATALLALVIAVLTAVAHYVDKRQRKNPPK